MDKAMKEATAAMNKAAEAFAALRAVERDSELRDVRFVADATGIEASGYLPDGREVVVRDGAYLDAAVALIQAAGRLR